MKFNQNASKLHKLVGELLSSTKPFSGMTIQQEVIVSSLFSNYSNNKDRYDYVVPELFLIIECHGIQHYKSQSFGAEAGDALLNFKTQKFRDSQKKEIALLSGWNFVEIPYTDQKKLAEEYLLDAVKTAHNKSGLKKADKPDTTPPSIKARQNRFKEESNKRRREYNRSLYKRLKQERKDGTSNKGSNRFSASSSN